MTITDEAVEAHARAMCRAMGLDPDGVARTLMQRVSGPDATTGRIVAREVKVFFWQDYADHARLYLASRAAEAELAATPAATRP